MPGVNLDFLPASRPPEALGGPDGVCAESGLQEVIADLLAHEDEEEPFCKKRFELTLRRAVGEIYCDLQAFGKRVDARLEEAGVQVAPLAEAVARLQEENLRLRIQQERLMRQVEALCLVMGRPHPLLHCQESAPTTPCANQTASCSDPPARTSPDSPQGSPSAPQDTPAGPLLDTPSNERQESLSCPPDSDSVSAPNAEPSAVPHHPTAAAHRSLSAPAMMAHMSCTNGTVLRSVNGSQHANLFTSDEPREE